jgi:hypothetical protein
LAVAGAYVDQRAARLDALSGRVVGSAMSSVDPDLSSIDELTTLNTEISDSANRDAGQ